MCANRMWGPVCGGGLTEAYVICRELGYDAGRITLPSDIVENTLNFTVYNIVIAPRNYTTISQFGSGSRPFAYQLTNCFGWERNISACSISQQFNCSQSQAAGLICRDGKVIETHE